MHPAFILIPAAGLLIGPRWWASHVLKQYNLNEEELPGTASELARRWLDENNLQAVRVKTTDIGDHYDPYTKTIRLARDKFDRKTLTAITTAAHEVSHAVQDASGYQPFTWRLNLGKVAQTVGEVGTLLLISVPAAALISGRTIPTKLLGTTIYAMLGTGMAAQLVALPTELDASFRKALPMLQANCIQGAQVQQARKILVATSLTYVAASLLSVLHIWPWLGRSAGSIAPLALPLGNRQQQPVTTANKIETTQVIQAEDKPVRGRRSRRTNATEKVVRRIGKPIIRSWLKLTNRF